MYSQQLLYRYSELPQRVVIVSKKRINCFHLSKVALYNRNIGYITGCCFNEYSSKVNLQKMLNLMPWRNWRLTFFKIVDTRISFYSRYTHLLPPKPKSSLHHLKRGIQDFHMNYVLVPADKAAYTVVVVWRLYYTNTLKRELVGPNVYKLQPSLSERVIVDGHGCHTALHFSVKAEENQDKVPTLHWLPKLHKTL